MALTIGDRGVRPLTADEVMHMVDAGILREHERVELLHGMLTEVSPQSEAHAAVVQRLTRWLAPLVAAGAHDLRVQLPLAVPDRTSLPEPDIAVLERDEHVRRHPTHALLVIEVAVSSLETDTAVKPALYAGAGVPEVWIVDVLGRRLRVLTDPTDQGYAAEAVVEQRGTARPAGVDVEPLELTALFAGL